MILSDHRRGYRTVKTLTLGLLVSLGVALVTGRADWATNRLVVVREAGATAMAIHALHPWLAVGRQGVTNEAVQIYRLEPNGQPGTSAWVTLSAPPLAPGIKSQMVTDLIFHPREPLLYVRWDWSANVLQEPATAGFSNSLGSVGIYQLGETGLAQVLFFAKGAMFATGLNPARMALDADARRLYLSNLALTPGFGLGALPVLTNGWPRLSDGEWVPVTVNIDVLRGVPNGWGFLAFSNAVITGTQFGPATWDAGNRLAPLGILPIRELVNQIWVGGAPELFAVYGLEVNRNLACWVAQSDGFLSGRPQTRVVEGAAFCAPPAVVTRPPRGVAAPSPTMFHFIPINAEGRFEGEVDRVSVPGGGVRDMKYSARLDRLYVLQEVTP